MEVAAVPGRRRALHQVLDPAVSADRRTVGPRVALRVKAPRNDRGDPGVEAVRGGVEHLGEQDPPLVLARRRQLLERIVELGQPVLGADPGAERPQRKGGGLGRRQSRVAGDLG